MCFDCHDVTMSRYDQITAGLPAEVESLEAFAVKQDEVVMSAFKESFNSGQAALK